MAGNGVYDKAVQQLVKDVFKRMVFAEFEADFNEWFTSLDTFLTTSGLPQVYLSLSPMCVPHVCIMTALEFGPKSVCACVFY